MSNSQNTTLLLCGHGSRSPKAAEEFETLKEKLQTRRPHWSVHGAFLEFCTPDIPHKLRELYDQGHRKIFVQPLTLYPANHTSNDIPALLDKFQQSYPKCQINYGGTLGLSEPLMEAIAKSINTALGHNNSEGCKLLVVGRGSNDRIVRDQTITLCRKLHERLDFNDSRYCYLSESTPVLEDALKQVAHSHSQRAVIMPILLFSGRLLSEIYQKINLATQKYPHFTYHKASPLGQQGLIIDAILEKIEKP